MILSNTRWAEDDLAGRRGARENEEGNEGDRFEVLTFPAIAEPSEAEALELTTPEQRAEWRDIIGRREGEPLKSRFYRGGPWEESLFYRARATLMRKNPLSWAADYQQNPTSREGSMFPESKWVYYHPAELPELYAIWRVWDLAASEG
jgi:hypothetical protein